MVKKTHKLVLSVDKMKTLINMGIDTSNASMYWVENEKENKHELFLDDDVMPMDEAEECSDPLGGKIIPTFTFQDILEIIPNVITTKEDNFELHFSNYQCYVQYIDPKHHKMLNVEFGDSILDAAFNMLIWCKENNFIQ